MGILLRLTKLSVWTGQPDPQQRAAAIDAFRRRDVDTDGLSLFEYETTDDLNTILGAIACMRETVDKPIDLLHIEREVIERIGGIDVTDGDTPVPRANKLHRSLNWSESELIKLAEQLFDGKQKAKRYKPAEVRQAVACLEDVTTSEAEVLVSECKEKLRGATRGSK